MRKLAAFFSLAATLSAEPSYAYIGPGLGAGVLAVILGILASLVLALVALVWYPVKRFRKRNKREGNSKNEEPEPPDADRP